MGLVGKGLQKWEEVLVKAEYAYDYGMPQWLARLNHALLALQLERLFLGRHKFNHYRVWYQNVLGDYVKEILLDPRTLSRPYVQRRQLEAIVQAHLSGSRNYTNEIHIMLTLELLHRMLVDKPNIAQGNC
jgi:asparagine synthase (glutamine-hydrolysing)